MFHDDDDGFMPPRSQRAPNPCNEANTNATPISADDPNDDFIPARLQRLSWSSSEDLDDHDHADDIFPDDFEDIYRRTIPRVSDDINYEDWKRMNGNFPFKPFY